MGRMSVKHVILMYIVVLVLILIKILSVYNKDIKITNVTIQKHENISKIFR